MVVYGLTLFELLNVIAPIVVAVGSSTLMTMAACPILASLKIMTSPGMGTPRSRDEADAEGISLQSGWAAYTAHKSNAFAVSRMG